MIGVLAFSFFIICGCWYCALIEKCCEPQRIWVDSKHPAVSFISIDSLFEKELYIQKVYCINRCTYNYPQQFISPSHPNNISNKMIHKCTKCEYQTPYKSTRISWYHHDIIKISSRYHHIIIRISLKHH